MVFVVAVVHPAVEAGVRVTEADDTEHSVGLAGRPDASGVVTLDAAIMNHDGSAGAVACVRAYAHPISIARLVMERTSHVLLVGGTRWAQFQVSFI
jgi:N4-(beta-N-acetylglucosaminyl)-L-asparaginase